MIFFAMKAICKRLQHLPNLKICLLLQIKEGLKCPTSILSNASTTVCNAVRKINAIYHRFNCQFCVKPNRDALSFDISVLIVQRSALCFCIARTVNILQ